MFKLPQMFQLGNFGLVLSHSFKTGITLAFLHGWSVLTEINAVTGEKMDSHFTQIRKLIRSKVSLWAHPLLLPVILLKEHLNRATLFENFDLLQETTDVEQALGVTHSGRLTRPQAGGVFNYKKLMENEEVRIALTTTLNTTFTDVISLTGVLKWDRRFCDFLSNKCDQIQEFRSQETRRSGQKLKEWIDTLDCSIASNSEHAEILRAKLELQLSIVGYNCTPVAFFERH